MKVLFLSPHYPEEMVDFSRGLAEVSAQVIGVGDVPAAQLPARVRSHLHDYLQIPGLLDEGRALGPLVEAARRLGVDRIETLWEPLVLLAEGDVLHLSRHTIGYTGLAQLDWELVQGLHLMPAAEVLDAGHRTTPPGPGLPELDKVPGAGQPGFGGWLSADWFFLPHLEARVDAIGRQNGGMFMVQLHAYL